MAIDFTSQALMSIAGVTALTVDTNGYFICAGQPLFNVMITQATTVGSDVIPGGTVVFNVGSHFNTGNGRFTAPVAGIYYFRYQQLAQNASTGEFRLTLYKNGGRYASSGYITYKNTAQWRSNFVEARVQLAVNDYVTIRYDSGPAALYTDSNYGSFSGHFIG